MVTQAMFDNLRSLLSKAGADLEIELRDGEVWYTGNLGLARQRLAEFDEEHAALSQKVEMMADESNPIDEFWKKTDELLDAHPGLRPAAARFETVVRHPELAARAGVPGATRAKRQSKAPPGNSNHYQELFFSLSYQRERDKNISDQQARLEIARDFPALRAAAFAQDPKERFFGAVRFESEQNKLDLAASYKAVAGFLPQDAEVVL